MTLRTSIRLATEADFDRVVEVVWQAFLDDPVYNYFGSLKEMIPKDRDTEEKDFRRQWARFLLNLCILAGGRVTVLVEHSEGTGSERIVGVAEWLLPNKRVALWHVRTMVRAGIIGMLRVWGLNGLLRCGFEWLDGTEQTMLKAFRARDLGNPDATWYLFQIAVIPECQGKGYMSKLIREALNIAPDAVLSLDATTPGSRDKYVHVGFEVVGIVPLGKGKSNSQGLKAKGQSATGLEAYSMVRLAKGREK